MSTYGLPRISPVSGGGAGALDEAALLGLGPYHSWVFFEAWRDRRGGDSEAEEEEIGTSRDLVKQSPIERERDRELQVVLLRIFGWWLCISWKSIFKIPGLVCLLATTYSFFLYVLCFCPLDGPGHHSSSLFALVTFCLRERERERERAFN